MRNGGASAKPPNGAHHLNLFSHVHRLVQDYEVGHAFTDHTPRGASQLAKVCDSGCHIRDLALLSGIGFTVSLFVTGLAFDDPAMTDLAKIGIFAGSAVAGPHAD